MSPAIRLCSAALSWMYSSLVMAFLYAMPVFHWTPPPHLLVQ